ncbi:hypothetical protein DPMN_038945 [Dreissena polymorpha]|uniref:Uncharacterized protein n=1 Tax=Dreissena polymorpha TaxID=45954 RepID=A0A9D4RR81_DREPO|nr:hypothetical protein DPMN_038945 [Dreissena polymorpha]
MLLRSCILSPRVSEICSGVIPMARIAAASCAMSIGTGPGRPFIRSMTRPGVMPAGDEYEKSDKTLLQQNDYFISDTIRLIPFKIMSVSMVPESVSLNIGCQI